MGSLEVVGNKKVIRGRKREWARVADRRWARDCAAFRVSKVTRAKCEISKINPLFSQAVRDLFVGGARPPRGRRTATSGYRWGSLRPHRSPRVVGATVALWQV